ncbi:glutathione peroxidase [Bacillus ectoiniformans]|uniref:glutathione peroxidase n=1 Tax=Bacillus ectoiniformans TaxID=1494429 RepID=UPI001957C9FA|nr:glutathione peroxidase [Bacillus ectoiniformans]MBM7650489.1 glutathione peroxidase [Bacillus ectoiniformans]
MAAIHEFQVKRINGEITTLEPYKQQVLLIVNTASKCGFTPQFKELQSLYEKYQDQGFTVLGFPSDQFMSQEFDQDTEIQEFCQLNYGVSFPMFSKIDVKGKEAHPLFQFLTKEKSGLLTGDVKWNFTKFLVDRDGKVVERYAPQTSPLKIEKDLLKRL